MTTEQSLTVLASMYCACMQEVKYRLKALRSALDENQENQSSFIQAEFLAINFRKILELIAFATLSANKELYAKAYCAFAEHWNAKKLMNNLESLNPAFYPRPVISIQDKEGRVINLENMPDGFLGKDDFIKLYDKSSQFLHVSNPFGDPKWSEESDVPIETWVDLIWQLLKIHLVEFVDRGGIWLIDMGDLQEGDVVGYIVAENG